MSRCESRSTSTVKKSVTVQTESRVPAPTLPLPISFLDGSFILFAPVATSHGDMLAGDPGVLDRRRRVGVDRQDDRLQRVQMVLALLAECHSKRLPGFLLRRKMIEPLLLLVEGAVFGEPADEKS